MAWSILAGILLLAGCGAEPAEHAVEIVFRNGALVGAPPVIAARQGDAISLLIDSDVEATLHAHGLDDEVAIPSGEPTRVLLEAAYVGDFDLELHLAASDPAGGMSMGAGSGQAVGVGSMAHGDPVPAPAGMNVSIALTPDSVEGLNLQIAPTGFTWSPRGAGGAHVDGEGHAHVYVDGVKYARAYGPWLHLAGLAAGTRHVRVTLNANNHGEYMIAGEAVAAEATAEVSETASGDGHEAAALIVTKLSVSGA